MIAAALTSPCLIRSDGRTIPIEKPQFIECADGRFSAGVAGIPLRHATYSGTDLEQGRVAPSQSPSAVPTARDLNSNVQQIGRAHVSTPVPNAHLVCRLLLEQNDHYTSHHRTTK